MPPRGCFRSIVARSRLSELANKVAARLRDEALHAGCTLRVHVVEGGSGAWDRGRLEQVLVHLVRNAIKFGPGRPIDLEGEDLGLRARLIVRDQGVGIAAQDLERIFGRFEQGGALAPSGGWGLGLYLARQIVAAHGGTLRVESDLGRGSAFFVELPWASPS